MANQIKADRDTWRATLDTTSSPLRSAVVFFCVTNDQRPYRVVMVDRDEIASPGDLDNLSSDALRALFERSESMNVSPS